MKNVSTMVRRTNANQVVSGLQSDPISIPSRKISRDASMLVNKLFSELQAIFPTWRNTFPNEEVLNHAKKTWVKGFVDAGITSINQIKLGVKHARASKSPFWPAVGEFIDWCKPLPEDFGLPSREDAFAEAIGNLGSYMTAEWSHVAVQESARNTTMYVLKNRTEAVARKEFYRNYAVLVNRVIRGENLNIDVPKALPSEAEYRPIAQERAIENALKLKKLVGLS